MNNYTSDFFMLFCAGILFVIGYYYFMNKQYSISIFFIMLGGLSLRILPSTDILLHPWDERYHALVAKNLLLNPLKPLLYKNAVLPFDYKYWPECHIWLHKQPLTIWFISISYLFFGISEFSTRIPSIILSTFGIFLTYKIGEYVFNQKTGLFAGFLYAINGNIIGHMSGRYATDHTEISFLFFIQLAVLFSFFSAQKNGIMNSVLVGVFIGMAILCKWLVALIVIPLFIIIQLQSVNFSYSRLFYYLCVILIFIIIIVAPWQIYIMKTFPKEAYWEYSYNSQHFTRCLEGHCEDAFFYFKVLSVNFGIFIYIPIFYSIYACFRKKEYYSYLFLLIWISVPFFFFSMAKTKMDGYLIIIYPALFLISSAFYFYLNQKTLTRKIISIFFISFFIIYSFHHYIEKNKLLCNFNRSPEWVTNLKKVDISKQKTILFNYPNPIEAMFYKDLTAYSYIPAEDTLLALKERGYQIIIYKNGSFSPL